MWSATSPRRASCVPRTAAAACLVSSAYLFTFDDATSMPSRKQGVSSVRVTAQQSSGNRAGYDDAKLRFYKSPRGLTSLAVGDRAICPRPLLSATQSVPLACVVDLKLASAPASAYRRSRGVEHVCDLTGWARTAAHWRRADPPASTDRRVGRARSRARCDGRL